MKHPRKVLLLGSGELGKELAIALARLGVLVVACDRYDNAPAMQVTPHRRVFNMLDPAALRQVVREELPDIIVPEIEAIATAELMSLEKEGHRVIPSAYAAHMTMNRQAIRDLAARELNLPTARYAYASDFLGLQAAAETLGFPCVVKPLMSSSGKGQSLVRAEGELRAAWDYSQSGGRTGASDVIVEEFIHFDHEITLLTVRAVNGTFFSPPIGHVQKSGDYIESWQPHPMPPETLRAAQEIALRVTDALGGRGIFGVELFLCKDGRVLFSELSPRPHDTGMVTMATGPANEFQVHAQAILNLPVHLPPLDAVAASLAFKSPAQGVRPCIEGLAEALALPGIEVRVFGKPEAHAGRRMAVVLARGASVEAALRTGREALKHLKVSSETT